MKQMWAPKVTEDGWLFTPGRDDVSSPFQGGLIDIYQKDVNQRYPLGAMLEDVTTGRRFRYCLAGATTIAPGKLMQQANPIADHLNMSVLVTAAGTGALSVTPGATAGAANLYKDGLAHINLTPGEGHAYRIKSHLAITASTEFILNLYDPIKVALTAASKVTASHNKFKNLIIHPSPPIAGVVGVPLVSITNAQFGWVQTRGPAVVLFEGTLLIGLSVMPSNTVDGAVASWKLTEAAPNTEITPAIGICLRVNVDTQYGLVDLKLE